MSYHRDGFVSAVPILSADEAAVHRAHMEAAEAGYGQLHYLPKIHTLFRDAAELAMDERVLNVVERLIGPNVLLFDVTYIVKEAHTSAYVSWHQNLAYWGFSRDQQVSMWLALSPSTPLSGCMRIVPGSHARGRQHHADENDPSNVLHRGQTVPQVAEECAVLCPLAPGEASFHHGWTLHASTPNQSSDRRIGLNVQYIAPSMRQAVNPNETALLVRGEDRYGYYDPEVIAKSDFGPATLARHAELDALRKSTWDAAANNRQQGSL